MQTTKSENELLRNWRVKVALLVALISPTVAATGAYYDLKGDVNNRISAVELRSEQTFADKQAIKDIQTELRQTHDDVIEIKTLLSHKLTK